MIKQIVPPGEVISILKTHRLGPRVANVPNSPGALKKGPIRHSSAGSISEVPLPSPWLPPEHLFLCRPSWKERQKLATACQEMKARIAKGERRLTIQDLKVVKTQRPYLWHDPLVIHIPPSIPVGDHYRPSCPWLCITNLMNRLTLRST